MTAKENIPLRFVLVGAGRIAQAHLEAMSTIPDARLVAIAEPRVEAGRAEAERQGCRHFTDAMDPELAVMADVAVVCTPPSTHFGIASHLLERGLHVLCEKPLTLNVADAEALVARADAAGRQIMMASKFRYSEDVIKARSIIESGLLGRVVLYDNTFASRVVMADRWNAKREVSGGGVLIDNGSHSVDIARYLLGPIYDVQVQTGPTVQGLDVEETARMHFRTKSQVMGTVDLSWSINKETDAYVSVYGTEGTLHVGWKASKYRQNGSPSWVTFGTGYDKNSAFKRQIENLIGVIRGREQPLIRPVDAVASVRVIQTAYASARMDNWVHVEGADA